MKLTQTVQKGGCAAKIAADELRKILKQVRFPTRPDWINVDGSHFDDAAIDIIRPDLALVETLDFFTPIVDTPLLFGKIAATNALSDVYAMGGTPRTALAILAFPATFEHQIIIDVLQGAADQIGKAGAAFVGGHSIDDDTLKFGLSVVGEVHPQKIWKNTGAKAGDILILTKALGTGVATAALKRQEVTEEKIQDEINSMSQLNDTRIPKNEDLNRYIHSATDITGFGLIGHSQQMALASQSTLIFDFNLIPKFKNTLDFIEKGFLTKAHRTNKEYTENKCDLSSLSDSQIKLICDPQTSGGLLLSVDPKGSDLVLKFLKQVFKETQIVGSVAPPGKHAVEFRN